LTEVLLKRDRVRNLLDEICRSLAEEDRVSLLDKSHCICDIVSLFPENGEGKTVLDVGIGRGYRSIPLSYMNYRVYGIESSWETIYAWKERCYRPYGIKVKECDIAFEEFPFPDDHFDWVILCGSSIEKECSPVHALSEIKRISKPNALLVLYLPNLPTRQDRSRSASGWYTSGPFRQIRLGDETDSEISGSYTMKDIADLVEGYGFRVILKLYRNAHAETRSAVAGGLQKVVSFMIPRFRDTVIMVCEKK
jgi:SAM-dependent methyltransferase